MKEENCGLKLYKAYARTTGAPVVRGLCNAEMTESQLLVIPWIGNLRTGVKFGKDVKSGKPENDVIGKNLPLGIGSSHFHDNRQIAP